MNRPVFNEHDPLYDFLMKHSFALKNQQWGVHVLQDFKQSIQSYYEREKRCFRWRSDICSYYVVVSEIMLQQTQTQRVEQKFDQFVAAFPHFQALAVAPLATVLALWVGLGYNRRARALHLIAQRVVADYGGILPDCAEVLKTFYGLGPATASSIVTFAFNKKTVFIETNILAVFLHVFFNVQKNVPDSLIVPLVAATVDHACPREWYYALMDYGVVIKKIYKNPSRNSRHYAKQSKFEGSDRQIRGWIIATIAHRPQLSIPEVQVQFSWATEVLVEKIVNGLVSDKLIVRKDKLISMA